MEDVSDVETDAIVDKDKTSTPPLTPAERGKIGPQIVGVEDIEVRLIYQHLEFLVHMSLTNVYISFRMRILGIICLLRL